MSTCQLRCGTFIVLLGLLFAPAAMAATYHSTDFGGLATGGYNWNDTIAVLGPTVVTIHGGTDFTVHNAGCDSEGWFRTGATPIDFVPVGGKIFDLHGGDSGLLVFDPPVREVRMWVTSNRSNMLVRALKDSGYPLVEVARDSIHDVGHPCSHCEDQPDWTEFCHWEEISLRSNNRDISYVDLPYEVMVDWMQVDVASPGPPEAGGLPPSVVSSLNAGETETQQFPLSNIGDQILTYSAKMIDVTPAPLKSERIPVKRQLDNLKTEGVRSSGGPNSYGYAWIDNNSIGGPVFDWINLTGVGTDWTETNNKTYMDGFSFDYYGETYDSLYICEDGMVTFTEKYNCDWHNEPISYVWTPDTSFVVFSSGFDVDSGGSVLYQHDVANDRFIVQWKRVPYWDQTDQRATFELILNGDGTALFQYNRLDISDRGTVGINDESEGLEIVHNLPYLEVGVAILFSPPSLPLPTPWVEVSPYVGQLNTSQSHQLDIVFNSTGLADGEYLANLELTTNSPSQPLITIPLTLNVGTSTEIEGTGSKPPLAALRGAQPNPFGPSTSIQFEIPAGGREVRLTVYDLAGRHIRTLVNGHREPGRHFIEWDGRDDTGSQVYSGVYFYHIESEDFRETRKLTVIR